MRFRANIDNVPTFFRTIQAIEKLQKMLIIKFSETHMRLICNNDTNEGGIQVWSQIKVESMFSKYRIQSNAGNEITMHLSSEALLGALRSASTNPSSLAVSIGNGGGIAGPNAGGGGGGHGGGGGGNGASSIETDEVVMKLSKKNDQAILSFEISGATRLGRTVRVVHDVRIEVLKPVDAAKLTEPMCPEPDLHILLPPLQKLRTIVERLRPMSNIMAIRANNSGRLQLAIHTEGVKIETEWQDCVNPNLEGQEKLDDKNGEGDGEHEKDPDKIFTVIISIRSFLKFLNSHVVSTTTIACVCHQHCLILYVYIGELADAGGVLTFYIPAVIDE